MRVSAQTVAVPCEPSRETLRLLETLPPLEDRTIPFAQRTGALRALASQHPDDFFIQRAYQDSFRNFRHLAAEFDRALAMYAGRRNDRLARYWEARLLMYHDPQQAKAAFTELLAANPGFPWPHLDFAAWLTFPGRREDTELAGHVRDFNAACPEAFAPGVVENANRMRAAMERRNTPLELSSWLRLWTKEEKAGLPPDELRARVRRDLARIEAWPFRADLLLWYVYREAVRILQEPALLDRLRARVEREAQKSRLALFFIEDQWHKEHPTPARDASPDAWTIYQRAEEQAIKEWLKGWPNELGLCYRILGYLDGEARYPGAVIAPDDLAFLDHLLAVEATSPDAAGHWPAVEIEIARIYAAARVRLDRVPALLEAGLRNTGRQTKYELSPELFPAEMRSRGGDWNAIALRQTQEIRADYFLAADRPDDARALAEQSLVEAQAPAQPGMRIDRSAWLRRLAEADAHLGREEDALRHYQESLAGMDAKSLATPSAQRLLEPVKQFYLAHGGTEENWLKWATEKREGKPAGRPAPEFVQAIPAFTARDLAGRAWELRDFQGKATLVNYWATWCGPCRGEHPDLQKLYDFAKSRKDIQVLTISVDESASAVAGYLKEKGYTFPVIRDPALADKLFPYAGLPTNFLVNAKAVRTSIYGFGNQERIIEDLEQAVKP
jgi:thiol-disulfide isomerase/thioredoxin